METTTFHWEQHACIFSNSNAGKEISYLLWLCSHRLWLCSYLYLCKFGHFNGKIKIYVIDSCINYTPEGLVLHYFIKKTSPNSHCNSYHAWILFLFKTVFLYYSKDILFLLYCSERLTVAVFKQDQLAWVSENFWLYKDLDNQLD